MNGTRAHHIVSTYAVTFFDWLLKGGSDDLLRNTSPDFPEISLDAGDKEVFSNGTVVSTVNGTVISSGGSGPSEYKNLAIPSLTREKRYFAWEFLLMLLLAT